jgi:hypothetical protein
MMCSSDSNGAINMDLSDGIWSFCFVVKHTRIWDLDQDFLINGVVKRMALEILMTQVLVDQELSLVLNGLKIGNQGNV